MRNFKVLLIFMVICLGSLTMGFFLGQLAFLNADQGIQIETGTIKARVIFKSEASNLEKEIGTASLRFYFDVLTVCLNEPEKQEKIISTRVLTDFVLSSCLANILRPRGEGKQKNPAGRGDSQKNLL